MVRFLKFTGRPFARAFRKNKLSRVTSWLVVFLFLTAALVYLFVPDKTPFANRVCLPISNQPPGFEVKMLRMMENKPTEVQGFFSRLVNGTRSNDIYLPISNSRYEGSDMIITEFSAAGDSSFESRYNIAEVVYALNTKKKIIERNGGLFFETADGLTVEESINDIQAFIDGQYLIRKKFYMGTDRFGRDVLSRLMVSSRVTLFTSLAVTFTALLLGLFFGLSAGLTKGRSRGFILWMMRSVWSIPGLLLVAAIVFSTGGGFVKIFLASGFVLSMEVTRMIFLRIAVLREEKFISYAITLGVSRWRILKNYILPAVTGPLAAAGASVFCLAILVESGLSFLHLGLPGEVPSWGGIIRDSFEYMIIPGYAYLTIVPGIVLTMVSVIFVFHAHALRDSSSESYRTSLV